MNRTLRTMNSTSCIDAALRTLSSALIIIALISTPCWAENFFDGPTATVGDPMFFSIYSIEPLQKGNANLNKIAVGGFTTAGPHYHGSNGGDPIADSTRFYARVAEAAAEGLGLVGHITWHPDVINDTTGNIRPDSMDAIPEVDVRAHVRQVMDFTLNDTTANATIDRWYTMPEELRPWKSGEMNYLNIVADEVQNYDPLSRPVSMYNPNNRKSSDLETIVSQGLDTTMMGVYVTGEPFDTRGARVGLGVDRIMTAANNSSTTPIAVSQLSEDYDTNDILGLRIALGGASVSEAEAIEHVIRHDVYQGLIRGIEGVQIWSGCDCRAGLTTYTKQLDGYISVSEDLNGTLNLADVFLQGENRTDFSATVLSGPSTVTYAGSLADPNGYTVDSVTVSDIAYGDSRYLFLANSSNSQLSISVDGLLPGVPVINDLFANAPELAVNTGTGIMTLGMEPLEVIALEIESLTNADADGDGLVSGSDFLAWQSGIGTAGSTTVSDGDFNYDGVVDGSDLSAWQSQYGNAAPLASVATIPEPASWLLMICVGGILPPRTTR